MPVQERVIAGERPQIWNSVLQLGMKFEKLQMLVCKCNYFFYPDIACNSRTGLVSTSFASKYHLQSHFSSPSYYSKLRNGEGSYIFEG